MAGVFGTKGEGSGERVKLIYMDIKWRGGGGGPFGVCKAVHFKRRELHVAAV